jgi:hypothetical protein
MTSAKIFISFKTDVSKKTPQNLHRALEQKGYETFLSKVDLNSGSGWDVQIYNQISTSDIFLLLLARGTEASDWVRREVDIARGAHVYIVPVLLEDIPGAELEDILNHFALGKIQVQRYIDESDHEFADLLKAIEDNKLVTRDLQVNWLSSLKRGEKQPLIKEAAPLNARFRSYKLANNAHQCRIHLATGDMTDMRNIDVLVNSENNYLQMARIFESYTLSSKLRLHGSLRDDGGRILEDSVQQELYLQITRSARYRTPVDKGYFVPTHAGHSESKLRQNGARYIFHVVSVAVEYDAEGEAIRPISNRGIQRAVTNCLEGVIRINRDKGVISPVDTELWQLEQSERDSYKPITSIIFPLFATGHGRRQDHIREVAVTMLKAICDFLSDEREAVRQLALENIYLCAYSQSDAEIIETEFAKLQTHFKSI